LKRVFKKILKWLAVLAVLLGVYVLGIYSYKNENVRRKVYALKTIENFRYSKYKAGRDTKTKLVNLIIPDSSKIIIETCRANAISDNILRDENKVEVPAQLIFEQDTFKIKMRLKGDYSDHWKGDKWSYRITMKGTDRLFGMKSFSLQAPETRRDLNEWYFHKLLAAEGLIALRYDFVNLSENGSEKGLYALEESFEKDLIEFNRRREAPILKFDESILIDHSIINPNENYNQENLFLMAKIDLFKSKRTHNDPILYDQFKKGKEILEKFRSGKLPAHEAFDIDKAAKLFAIADIIGGHHALRWKNVRFYFNPVLSKLELIGFDSNSGNSISNIYYKQWRNGQIGEYDVMAWKTLFFEDDIFLQAYFKQLKRFGNPEYIKNFHESIEDDLATALSHFYKEDSWFVFHKEYYVENCKLIAKQLSEYNKSTYRAGHKYFITASLDSGIKLGDTQLKINLVNVGLDAVKVLGIFNPHEEKLSIEPITILGSRTSGEASIAQSLSFNLSTPIDSNQIKLKRGKDGWVHKKIKIGYQFLGSSDTIYTRIEHYYETNIEQNKNKFKVQNCFDIDHKAKVITVKEGEWRFSDDVITPKGYSLECWGNTSIILNNHAKLTVNGAVNLKGTADHPVIIASEDSTGTFIVFQTSKTSTIEYAEFNNLSESHTGVWHVSGAVNFYEADVTLNEVQFNNNKSEDALNIVRSEFFMSNISFKNTQSDAFDGDFCLGRIEKASFTNIGNDALDFSGSEIFMKDIIISYIGDKGISAGENSNITGENITVNHCELGLVSKDLSILKVTKANLNQVAVPYTVFQKKGVFGPAVIELIDFSASEFKEQFLVETGSNAKVNGDSIVPNHQNVSDILYGEMYGKSSK